MPKTDYFSTFPLITTGEIRGEATEKRTVHIRESYLRLPWVYPPDRERLSAQSAGLYPGLTVADDLLHEGTGRKGRSTLGRMNLKSGKVLQRFRLPDPLLPSGTRAAQGLRAPNKMIVPL